jgi:hypothetical protein
MLVKPAFRQSASASRRDLAWIEVEVCCARLGILRRKFGVQRPDERACHVAHQLLPLNVDRRHVSRIDIVTLKASCRPDP